MVCTGATMFLTINSEHLKVSPYIYSVYTHSSAHIEVGPYDFLPPTQVRPSKIHYLCNGLYHPTYHLIPTRLSQNTAFIFISIILHSLIIVYHSYSAVNRHGQSAPRTGFFHFFKKQEVS